MMIKRHIILITSDLIHELKKKIPQISSLNEVPQSLRALNMDKRRINGKNIRTAYGTKKQLLDFLWME